MRGMTTGWVGLGFSPASSGKMQGKDYAIGWVKSGVSVLQDRFGDVESGRPSLDAKQDLVLVAAEESGSWTTVEFTRPRISCDAKDLSMTSTGTYSLVWAHGAADPDTTDPAYHSTSRGSKTFSFFDDPAPAAALEANTVAYAIRGTQSFTIPAWSASGPLGAGTNYRAYVVKLPQAVINNMVHVTRFAPLIDNPANVHHILVYGCSNFNVGASPTTQETTYDGPGHIGQEPQRVQDCNGGE